MSLILEALRKSEQQRRLGEVPTLGSESAWAGRRWHGGAARAPRWPWLLAAVLLAGGAAGWWWLGPREAPPSAPVAAQGPTTGTAAAPAVASVPAPPVAGAAAADPAPSVPAPAVPAVAPLPVAPTVDPAVRLEVPTPSVDGEYPSGPASADASLTALPMAPAPPPGGEPIALADAAPVPATPPVAPTSVDTPSRAEPPSTGTLPAAAASPVPISPPTPVEPTAPVTAPPPAAANDVPLVYALPLPVRQALPPLKLAMHVWNADPARRFVILGETRAAEGEAVATEVQVVEIRRDGVVLDFRGTRFLLPRSGW